MHKAMDDLFNSLGIGIKDPIGKRVSVEDTFAMIFNGLPNLRTTPHYDPGDDGIYIPDRHEHYDHVAAHELIHWTSPRLKRKHKRAKQICCGKHSYVLEELTADFGALMLLERLGVPTAFAAKSKRRLAHHRQYFGGHTSSLTKKEAHAIAKADAEEAVEYLLSQAQQVAKAA